MDSRMSSILSCQSRGMDGFRQDSLTQLSLKGIGGHQVHSLMQAPFQIFLKREELEVSTRLPCFEFHQEIQVAVQPGLIPRHRPEDSDVLHRIPGTKLGESRIQDGYYFFTTHDQDPSCQYKEKPSDP